MKLSECKEGEKVIIRNIIADDLTKKKLFLLGVYEGRKLLVAKENNGAVLLAFQGKMVAVGRALAKDVSVDACIDCR